VNLARMEQLQFQKRYQLQELKAIFEKQKHKIEAEIADIEKQRGLILADMDEGKVVLAESILRFSHGFSRLEDRIAKKAIEDIVNGCDSMKDGYFGIKDYAHWRSQESHHSYGYGPKHGYIVFSIGLKHPKKALSPIEQEACIYYLYQLIENKSFVATLLKEEEEKKKGQTYGVMIR